jgi:hypothetical protein
MNTASESLEIGRDTIPEAKKKSQNQSKQTESCIQGICTKEFLLLLPLLQPTGGSQ